MWCGRNYAHQRLKSFKRVRGTTREQLNFFNLHHGPGVTESCVYLAACVGKAYGLLLRRACVEMFFRPRIITAPSLVRGVKTAVAHPLAATRRLHARMTVFGAAMTFGAMYYVFFGFRRDQASSAGAFLSSMLLDTSAPNVGKATPRFAHLRRAPPRSPSRAALVLARFTRRGAHRNGGGGGPRCCHKGLTPPPPLFC